MSEKIPLPVLNNYQPAAAKKEEVACNSCKKAGCKGGLGIKQGSEKDEVLRILFLYLSMGTIMFVVAYILMRLLTLILG